MMSVYELFTFFQLPKNKKSKSKKILKFQYQKDKIPSKY
jgi:hypothetical protein